MRMSRQKLCLAAALLAAAVVPASAGAVRLRPPPVTWMPGAKEFTPAHRKPTDIRLIVIHVSQSSFLGTVSWLRNPASHASANFVVSRAGAIAELVPKRDIAWHAGNWAVNVESVGIEHVGITDDPAGFTKPEYRASAQLVAYIARTSLIPIDRQHIIGHSEVPDPTDPLLGGGIDNHTDPGNYWNWRRYMRLVRSFAFPPKPHVGLGVESSTLYRGQTVAGTVPWRVQVRGPVRRVSFLVDGHIRWSDTRRPFAYAGGRGLHTTAFANGRHTLELRAYSARGSWTRDRFAIQVRNVHYVLSLGGVRPGQPVAGTVAVQALALGAPTLRVALLLDGKEIDHDTSRPFAFHWDTTRAKDGKHVLSLRARARGGYVATAQAQLTVANDAPAISLVAPANSQVVTGSVPVVLQASGKLRAVDLLVDGQVIATATAAPWTLAWNADATGAGLHLLSVRADGTDGATATDSVGVTVGPAVSSG
jgi:N-acetyl-anhydromuramyl-L-alanine amidase AmpD